MRFLATDAQTGYVGLKKPGKRQRRAINVYLELQSQKTEAFRHLQDSTVRLLVLQFRANLQRLRPGLLSSADRGKNVLNVGIPAISSRRLPAPSARSLRQSRVPGVTSCHVRNHYDGS